jgi:2-dehydropantoate 2-reductase
MPKMRLLVLGAGGVGGYFGGRLAQAGADVTFLVRPRRRDQLARDGLVVRSPFGDFTLPVRAIVADELRDDYDVVLLTCKAYDLDSAMDAIAPAMTGACAVVPLLNGMSHLDRLDERFGADHVLGGICALEVTLAPDGTVVHSNRNHRIAFGERGGRDTGVATRLADEMKPTLLDWEHSPVIEHELWEKIVTLSVLAGCTCLFRATVGEILRAPGGRDVITGAIATNIEIATREGFPPRPPRLEWTERLLLDPSSTLKASMLRDMERGARVEADHVIGWMLGKAREHGLDAPLLAHAYTALKAYEARIGQVANAGPAPAASVADGR